MRPFGIATLIAGFDPQDPAPRLYCTDPSGIHNAWKVVLILFSGSLRAKRLVKANAVGRSSKTVREFLEKNHKEDMNRVDTIKLTIKSLLEVVQTGAKNIEITVMESFGKQTVRIPKRSIAFVHLMPYGRASLCKKSRRLFQRLKGRRSKVSLPRVCGNVLLTFILFTEAERKRSRLAATTGAQASMSSRTQGQPGPSS